MNQKTVYLANNSLINSVWYCRLFNSNKFDPNGPYQLVTLVTMYQYVNATVSQTNNSSIISEIIQNGNALFNTSEYDKAMTTFDQVLKLDSRSVDALNGKGLVLNNLGKYQEAISMV